MRCGERNAFAGGGFAGEALSQFLFEYQLCQPSDIADASLVCRQDFGEALQSSALHQRNHRQQA